MLEARKVGLRIEARELVRDLDMALAPGEFCALLGRNGAGKTSLILALAGLRSPQSGAVAFDGALLAALPRRTLAQRVGVLLQDENADFWGSVTDYVLLGRHARRRGAWGADEEGRDSARHWLAELDLAEHADQACRTLSGGERQRARIAQLLVQDPDVLLLDEPLQHLDLRYQGLVMRLLAARASAGKAVLAALHEPGHAAQHCDRCVLLYDAGRAELGRSGDKLTQANLEALYQCRLEPAGATSFRPT